MTATAPDDMRRLEGRVAIVTGSGGGIGRAEALLLAQQGAAVVVNDVGRDEDGSLLADRVVEEIRAAGGRAEADHGDVSDAQSTPAMVAKAFEAFGGLDIVINNAGINRANLVEEIPDEQWDTMIGIHLRGTFLLIKHAVPGFKRQRSGVIVNTASESGLGHPTASHYSSAKEGIVGLTRSVAREVGGFGIRCNAIRPRALDTRMALEFRQTAVRWNTWEMLGRYALGERGNVRASRPPDQIAPMAVWLCTDAAAHINGYTFASEGSLVGIWSEPALYRSIVRPEGWDLAALDDIAPQSLTFDLENRFLAEFEV